MVSERGISKRPPCRNSAVNRILMRHLSALLRSEFSRSRQGGFPAASSCGPATRKTSQSACAGPRFILQIRSGAPGRRMLGPESPSPADQDHYDRNQRHPDDGEDPDPHGDGRQSGEDKAESPDRGPGVLAHVKASDYQTRVLVHTDTDLVGRYYLADLAVGGDGELRPVPRGTVVRVGVSRVHPG